MSPITGPEAARVLAEADRLCSPEEVEAAYRRMAAEITARLADRDPLVLVVMNGGLIPAGRLLPLLDFPLQYDYVHATRYRGGVLGKDLQWRVRPEASLEGRTVLVIDDILDEGITLAAILDWCRGEATREVLSAVLVDKRHGRKSAIARADFTGLEVADRYLFGCGMDYRGYLRNLPGIYAVKGL